MSLLTDLITLPNSLGILFALVAIEEDSVIDKKFNDINKVL